MFETLSKLIDAEVDFVLIGGLAVALHGSLSVPIASIEHLIAMKSGTGRGKDAVDIDELRRLQARES